MAPFNLGLQPFEQRRLNLDDAATLLAGEVEMLFFLVRLVVMTNPSHMHEVKLVNDSQLL